ncbi:tryptophan--tRNA ligase [Candidatus Uhrbacteria bacterium RIFCSPHIGHO2_12_FULL_60_25]|uniref:Tryptophan--tRNA ligase n=1 Tax=Candidatus Uhrbacteria bacterium RIFCSPHIGHO2_12_FULL_60_25 TaxID=1802399 RepID=A0A1F7UMV4_9BACT|nr:MAG: tryptophan--tRNA ligase [Candidatus Uhrbacteria bacterium RIFCSPHIGHO2_02_FULL_60_44]OGL79017.1 MAG: tryptophan--tRNA ligase [Candidatus Uhrbacteria bacterium RIFCSPHIGHO2_12_FULL_60_25]
MKSLCLSGVQPTNFLHVGNYIGALKQWVEIQHRFPCYFCIVDLHAITVAQDPKQLRENVLNTAATYLAVGIDPKRSHVFIQSEVHEHAELGWILGTITRIAELERMTQFKDKAKRRADNVGVGLFTYPALMAADILLYDTTVVPVGEDQMQHVELTRTIARRFNTTFGDTFVIPQALIQKQGARIMGLDDPSVKMSKSATSTMNYIALTDDDDTIRKKIMRAVTDSGKDIVYDPDKKPAVTNLLTIFHHMTGRTIKDLENEFEGKGYGDLKKALADAVIAHVGPIRDKIAEYRKDPKELMRVLDAGRDAAQELATTKMKIVRERVGLGRA